MEKLLQLVPRFQQAVEDCITGGPRINVLANFAETSVGPIVVDHHNPAIKLVLQGQENLGMYSRWGVQRQCHQYEYVCMVRFQIGKLSLLGLVGAAIASTFL